MTAPLLILLLLAMAATAYVLVRGVIAMASGKDVTGEQQQNYMRKRVLFQAIAIVIVPAGAWRTVRRSCPRPCIFPTSVAHGILGDEVSPGEGHPLRPRRHSPRV